MILLICMMLHAESRGSGGLPSPTYAWPEPVARRYASILDVPQPTPHRNRQSRPTRNADRRRSASKLTGCGRQAGGSRYASESVLLCMPEHAQHDICPATNDQHQPIHPLTHTETYAASRTHLNQLPEPTNQHRHACPDTRNTTNTSQSAATGRHHYSLRMPGHTQPPAITQQAAAPTPASTPAPAPPPHRRERTSAIDHFDRGTRRRITARVWRAAAPRRPRSSSIRAG